MVLKYTVAPRFIQGFIILIFSYSISAQLVQEQPPTFIAPTIGEIFNISCNCKYRVRPTIWWDIRFENNVYNLSENKHPQDFELVGIINSEQFKINNYYLNSTLSFILPNNSFTSYDEALIICTIHTPSRDLPLKSQIILNSPNSITPSPGSAPLPINLTPSSPHDSTVKVVWDTDTGPCEPNFNISLKKYQSDLSLDRINDLPIFMHKEVYQGNDKEIQFNQLDIGFMYIFRVDAICADYITQQSLWTSPFLLLKHEGASISTLPNKRTVTEGEGINISCTVSGFPEPGIFWRKAGNTDYTVNGATLSFESITLADSGVYTCLTSNVVNGEIKSDSANITIEVNQVESPPLEPSNCSYLISSNSVCSSFIPINQTIQSSRHLATLSNDIHDAVLRETGHYLGDKCYRAIMAYMCNMIFTQCDPLAEIENKLPDDVMCYEDCYSISYGDCHSKFNSIVITNTYLENENFFVSDCTHLSSHANSTCNFIDVNYLMNPTTTPPFHTTIASSMDPEAALSLGANTIALIAGVVVALLFIVIVSIVIFIFCYTFYRRFNKPQFCSSRFIDSKISDNPFYLPFTNKTSLVEKKEFPRASFKIVRKLGQGQFGFVELAEAKNIIPGEKITSVAAKSLHEGATLKNKMDFEREAEIMLNFDHPNILRLLGVSFKDKNFLMCLLFEYMENGDLNNYLRSCGSCQLKRLQNPFPLQSNSENDSSEDITILNTKDLVFISSQVASGMKYLSDRCFVHRDLATRNCLVGENLTVKIGDFGMSKDVYKSDYYRIGKDALLPIKWMAPEAIMYGKATIQTDIWSFGVLMWEVFSFAMQPWYGCTNEQVIEKVKTGSILAKPDNSPQLIYSLMLECWKADPDQRINFTNIDNRLSSWSANGISESVTNSSDEIVPSNSMNNPFVADPFLVKPL